MRTLMEKRGDFSAMGQAQLVLNECIGLEDRFEPLCGIARLVSDLYQPFKVAAESVRLMLIALVCTMPSSKRRTGITFGCIFRCSADWA